MKRLVILLMAILPMAFILSTAEAKPNKQKVVLYVYLHCQDCCDKIMKNIPFDKVIRTFAGLRPGSDVNDFVIEQSEVLSGFVNVACIESPGLASAPAIAEYVCDTVMKEEFSFHQKQIRKNTNPFL